MDNFNPIALNRAPIAMLNRFASIVAVVAIAALSACAKPEVARGINDPFEEQNRAVHEFNKSIDRNVLRPVSSGYGESVPGKFRKGVANVAGNLATPGYVVNDVLQGNIYDATSNTLRFLVNTTFGLAGLLDVATDMGIPERDSDFGQTLHVWGFEEGHYVELPFLGPSTKRDAIGKIFDIFTNPLSYTLPTPESYAMPAARGLAGIDTRYQYRDLVDSILYESADSYAQARLLYLERRRFELGGDETSSEGEYDPNANPFAEYE